MHKGYNVQPKPIYLHITTVGGSVSAAFRLIDNIKFSKIPVYTVVEGYAYSAGSMILLAGKKRFMTEHSFVLIHQLRQTSCGTETYSEMLDSVENSTKYHNMMKKWYLENTNNKMKTKDIEKLLSSDKELDLQTCIKFGLVDEIYKGQ